MPISPATRSVFDVRPVAGSATVQVGIEVEDKAGKPVTNFTPIHTKPMHLVTIGSGLQLVGHDHPTLDSGKFEGTVALPAPGKYVLFDKYDPAGPVPETIDRFVLNTGGARAVFAAPTWDFKTRTKTVDGLTFALAKGDLMVGMEMPIKVVVTDGNGKPAKLQTWLAAKGHMFASQAGAPALYHFHPSGMVMGHGGMGHMGARPKPGELIFDAKVEQAGPYRLFVDVMKPGSSTRTTVSFDVTAQ